MTSGTFTSVPISSIFVDRENRQRRELTGIEELAESIRRNGLINPIIITREDHKLVAGERRLAAHRHLGRLEIIAQFAEDLDPVELELIELDENVKRVDLSWQDRVAATARYHELRKASEKEWSIDKTAEELGVSDGLIRKQLTVSEAIKDGVTEVADAPKFSTALNFAERRKERMKASAKRDLSAAITPTIKTSVSSSEDLPEPEVKNLKNYLIQNGNFIEWSKTVQQTPFNLIHCDFPYGRSTGDKSGQSAAAGMGKYDDSEETYYTLLNNLVQTQDNFIAPSAHMIFWFSMYYYADTKAILEGAGWVVDYMPLVWHKTDNAGVIPDPKRGGRNTYETAFFCTRGDRKIVRPVAKSFAGPTTKLYHTSEKSRTMLAHFFRMTVDETTYMLDPTCGSGMSVRASVEAGATYSLGLELNPDFHASALENLRTMEE